MLWVRAIFALPSLSQILCLISFSFSTQPRQTVSLGTHRSVPEQRMYLSTLYMLFHPDLVT